MRAPAPKRSDKEIIADIIQRAGYPHIEALVRRLISDLRVPLPPYKGNQRQIRERVEEVGKLANTLERKLVALPETWFLPAALLGERFWQLEQLFDIAFEINPRTRGYITQEPERLTHLREELKQIKARRDQIKKLKLGQHGGINHQHMRAAFASRVILEEVANHTGKSLRLSRSTESPFVKIARLFLEATTGEYDADLTSACKAVKRYPQRRHPQA
jgi:hypothetical protein